MTLKPRDLVRTFNFEYEKIDETAVRKELDIYIEKQLKNIADQDLYEYTDLVGTDFETDEQRAI